MSKNKRTIEEKYMNIMGVVFLISAVLSIGLKIIESSLSPGYVFKSWLDVVQSVSSVIMVGSIIIILLSYININIGIFIIPAVLLVAYIGGVFAHKEEVIEHGYVTTYTQQLGEGIKRYYKDVNMFVMIYSHEEMIR